MKDMYMVNYSVKGIKTLEQKVSLSFYKKTISQDLNTQEYNIKGIYGMNGSGKSGIVTSVDILKNLLINPGYLGNPIVQKNLDAIINKKTGELSIEVDYIVNRTNPLMIFNYIVVVSRDVVGKYVISYEKLSAKKAISKSDLTDTIFEVVDGEIRHISGTQQDKFAKEFTEKTINLLSSNTMLSLFCEKILLTTDKDYKEGMFFASLCFLFVFANKLHVCIEQSDDHREHIAYNTFQRSRNNESEIHALMENVLEMERVNFDAINVVQNVVAKEKYKYFVQTINQMCEFIRIFKSDLVKIDIDKKINRDVYVCDLIMVYDSYEIHAEYESTGIKKLIRLYAYLKKMVEGEIVFIDEFDSNLHDVYLCALLEYLMEYAEGQLCFTTHNVGPMDILRQHKKSIDFLSVDRKIYSWKTNGNYSPAKLYRNGMIEGSPFNIDSIDFIGVFGSRKEDA